MFIGKYLSVVSRSRMKLNSLLLVQIKNQLNLRDTKRNPNLKAQNRINLPSFLLAISTPSSKERESFRSILRSTLTRFKNFSGDLSC